MSGGEDDDDQFTFDNAVFTAVLEGQPPTPFTLIPSQPGEAVFENKAYDADLFKQGVGVVVNLISDVDQAGAMLPQAADLVERLGKPTVNDPRKILRTTRDMVAALQAASYQVTHVEVNLAEHDWPYWQARFPQMLAAFRAGKSACSK